MTTPPRPLRVTHVIQNLNYGGMERLITDMVLSGNAMGLESHVVVLQYPGRFASDLNGHGKVHQCEPLPAWSLIRPGPLVRLLRRIGPDVVHSHSGVWHKASLAARQAGVRRVIHTEHGLRARDTWLARTVERWASRRTDVVVAVSEALAEVLARDIVSPDKLTVVPNGVDTARFTPGADTGRLRRLLGIPLGAPILGSIGRLEPVKGYDIMLAAFAQLCAQWGDRGELRPRLVIAGDGSARAALTTRVTELGLEKRVSLLGWRDDVHDLHASFTLFTLSSLSEGTSVSLLEAMSAGLCPVVTRVGGNPAVLGQELAHRLVPPRDPAALAAAWAGALERPDHLAADAAQARRRAESHFSMRAMMNRYAGLYRGGATSERRKDRHHV